MTDTYFIEIMDKFRQAQQIPCIQPVTNVIGRKCPKLDWTGWFCMLDTLGHFADNFAKCAYSLIDCRESFGDRDILPLEILELYIILLPFYCFISLLESRARALPDIWFSSLKWRGKNE
jgi:hypothetical protein